MNFYLLSIEKIIDKISIDYTFDLSDLISLFVAITSMLVTVIIAIVNIQKNNKNIEKQLKQQQEIFEQQMEASIKNFNENKNIELKKNQVECLPIIDIENLRYHSDGTCATFEFNLKNIGNGTAHNCFLDSDKDLVLYSDCFDNGLQYLQSSPGKFIINVDNSFNISITTNRIPNKSAHRVCFSVTYEDLMGRIYKQPFEFSYTHPTMVPNITNKYAWDCIKDIEFKI